MNGGSHLSFSTLFHPEPQPTGLAPLTVRVGPPISMNPTGNSLTDMPGGLSPR